MEVKYYTSNKTNYKELEELRKIYSCIGCVSGGFDPIHPGHIELLKKASEYIQSWKNSILIVLVNADSFLLRKKNYVFMKQEDRQYIVQSIKGVGLAIIYESKNQLVTEGLEKLRPDFFFNGGDRDLSGMAKEEVELCNKLGINLVFFGAKINSSSNLCENFYKNYRK